jgi:uncharacterized membrane protein
VVRRLIWVLVALLAISVVAFMFVIPTTSTGDGSGWLNWVWTSGGNGAR